MRRRAGQFRHAQQVPEFNERMATPGGAGTVSRAHAAPSAPESAGASFAQDKDVESAPADAGVQESALAEKAHPVRNVVAAVMTTLSVSAVPARDGAMGR